MKKYDVFISYRRDGGFNTAKQLSDLLMRDGYRVSFDIDTLRSGDFDKQLYSRIDMCRDFILIVDEHAFDRTIKDKNPRKNDWVRCELAYALEKKKNIILHSLSFFNLRNSDFIIFFIIFSSLHISSAEIIPAKQNGSSTY